MLVSAFTNLERRAKSSPVTVGFELEFMATPIIPDIPSVFTFMNYHTDWRYVKEISTPPMPLPCPDAYPVLAALETYFEEFLERMRKTKNKWFVLRVSEFYKESTWFTAGCHVHLRSNDKRLMTRMHNWAVYLTSIAAPLVTLNRRSDNIILTTWRNGDRDKPWIESSIYEAAYRCRFYHYCEKPKYITPDIISNVESYEDVFRGYLPDNDFNNSFYAVELNKYRKVVATVEVRYTENHLAALMAFAEMVYVLAKHYNPPHIDLVRYWEMIPVYNDYFEAVAVYGIPMPPIISPKNLPPVCEARTVPEFYQKLLELHGEEFTDYARKILKIVAEGKRVRWEDAHKIASS